MSRINSIGDMMKRLFDIFVSLFGLILVSPIMAVFCFLIWYEDKHSPFYVADRVGKNHVLFKMTKLRSMVINAAKSGVNSTSANDRRITPVGRMIRRYKLDELSQLWNVLKGEMSLVGPRPNVIQDVKLYTDEENKLLSVKPGITDFASIVFSDEGDILKGSDNPDLKYNQVIRPWKSRLGLHYVKHHSLWIDIQLIYLTVICIFSRKKALKSIHAMLSKFSDVDEQLLNVVLRENELQPFPPPGAKEIVSSY